MLSRKGSTDFGCSRLVYGLLLQKISAIRMRDWLDKPFVIFKNF